MEQESNSQKWAGYIGLACTLLYLTLFFPSFYIALLCPHLFENADMTTGVGVTIIFLSVCVPLSLIISICMIWYKYFRAEYKSVYYCATLPIVATITFILLASTIRTLFL